MKVVTLMSAKKHFFISYTNRTENDRQWAVWIANTLEQAGYSTILQAWDFNAGENFILNMHNALMNTERFLAVLSSKYFESLYCQAEWTSAFIKNIKSEKALFIPIRIEDVEPEGLFAPIVYIDLYSRSEEEAKDELIEKLKPSRRPEIIPGFPGTKKVRPGELPFNNLPYSKNPYFTGRMEILSSIYKNFQSREAISLVQSISGLGGVGKTSIALEYAYNHSHEYQTIWWINAENKAVALDSVRQFALAKNIISEEAIEDEVLEAMKHWFDRNEKWLFIYDNADAEDFVQWLQPFFPQTRKGHILITTRSIVFPKSKNIGIRVFNEVEAVLFLKRRSGKNDEGYSDESAKELAMHLQFFPLALEQAAAYVEQTPGVTFQEYIKRFEQYKIKIFENEENKTYLVDYTSTVAITWKISIDKIADEDSTQMFNMCAYFAPDKIPVNMFVRGNGALPEPLKNSISETIQRDRIITDLTRYSLLSCDRSNESPASEARELHIHRLVQEVVQSSFREDAVWLSHCFDLICKIAIWKHYERESIYAFKTEAPHAISVAGKVATTFPEDKRKQKFVVGIFHDTSNYYAQLSYLNQAAILISQAIPIAELLFRENCFDVSILLSAYSLEGTVHTLMKAYDKAIEAFSKSIQIGEELCGPDDIIAERELAIAYMNRGIAYEYLKKHETALIDKDKSLEIVKELYHKSHLNIEGHLSIENDIALTYMNRSVTYTSLHRYVEALADEKRCIEIWERMITEGKQISQDDFAKAQINHSVTASKIAVEQNKSKLYEEGITQYNSSFAKSVINNRKKKFKGGE